MYELNLDRNPTTPGPMDRKRAFRLGLVPVVTPIRRVSEILRASPALTYTQIFIFETPAPDVGRPITWRAADGTDLCLQVNSITGTLQEQFRNGGSLGM